MSPATRTLEQLQQWMQAVVTHQGGIAAGVASQGARQILNVDHAELETVILPGPSQTSLERLAVYGNAYYARLLHCLQELFPACRHAVGDEIFDEFAFGYLQAHPPSSYTLGNLARHFVEFLEHTRQEHFAGEVAKGAGGQRGDEEACPPWSRFLVELARFEFTIDEVFDGAGIENEPSRIAEQLASLQCADWASIRLVPAPCLRLLDFAFPINEYFTSFRRGQSSDIPEEHASYVAVTRRDYVVRRHNLDPVQYHLLSALVGGKSLAEAISKSVTTLSDEELAPRLSAWFRKWANEQFFIGIQSIPPLSSQQERHS